MEKYFPSWKNIFYNGKYSFVIENLGAISNYEDKYLSLSVNIFHKRKYFSLMDK
jgi:hypothetical protein